MAVLEERRVIRHPVMDARMAEPAVRQIQVHFLAQPALGANPVAIADDQHADDQLGINRRTAYMAKEDGPAG